MFDNFIQSLRRGWAFFIASLALLRQQSSLMVIPIMQLFILVGLAIVGGLAIFFTIDGGGDSSELIVSVISALTVFLMTLVVYATMGMTVNMIDVAVNGGEPSVKEAWADVRQNFFAILVVAIISTIVSLLTSWVRENRKGIVGVIGSIIMGIVESVWTVVSFLVLPAIIIEDLGFRDALSRVKNLHSKNVMTIVVGDVGVGWIVGLIAFALVGVTAGMIYAMNAVSALSYILIPILVLSWIAYFAFATYVRVAYHTCLFIWAAGKERDPDYQAPGPLGQALAGID
ncbi:MAG: DUF6159 family protein [Nannocystaceae bacterium]